MAMTSPIITCDLCGKDITYTCNCEDFRVAVRSESIGTHPEAAIVTAMAVQPEFKKPLHFCGRACLLKWASRQIERDAEANRQWEEKWNVAEISKCGKWESILLEDGNSYARPRRPTA